MCGSGSERERERESTNVTAVRDTVNRLMVINYAATVTITQVEREREREQERERENGRKGVVGGEPQRGRSDGMRPRLSAAGVITMLCVSS